MFKTTRSGPSSSDSQKQKPKSFSDQLSDTVKSIQKSESKEPKKEDDEESSSSEDDEVKEDCSDKKRSPERTKQSRTKLAELSEVDKASRHKEQMKEWRSKHPDYNKNYRQKYYAEHRDEILEKRRLKRQEEKRILEEFKAYKQSQVKTN